MIAWMNVCKDEMFNEDKKTVPIITTKNKNKNTRRTIKTTKTTAKGHLSTEEERKKLRVNLSGSAIPLLVPLHLGMLQHCT